MKTANQALMTTATILVAMLASPSHAYLCGDVNGNKSIVATDALTALRFSVGQEVEINCGPQHRTLVTGQTQCSNAAGQSDGCPGTGQDGELQKGAPRAFVDNGDGTVTDRGTGLQWELFDDNDAGMHYQDHRLDFTGAFARVALLNAGLFAGHSDWRIPNIFELMSIANLGRIDPGEYVPFFHHDCTTGCSLPNCACIDSPDYEWSSTSFASDAKTAWALEMRFGNPFRQSKDLPNYRVRAVRAGYTDGDVNNEPVLRNSCADVNASDSITATDALAILRKSVGQPQTLSCILRSPTLKTGQTTCYSPVGLAIPCAGTGQDGELQRGLVRAFKNNGDGTVTDDVTGLVWEILSANGSIHDRGNEYNWEEALDTKIADLNDSSFAGHSDWRLPNFFEVESLLNLGSATSAVYDDYFNKDCQPGCTNEQCSCLPQTGSVWSSTTSIIDKTSAFKTSLVTGLAPWESKTSSINARGVRGGD